MASNDASVIIGLSISFPILAIVSVIFRFEARRIKRLQLAADDWTILAALVRFRLPCIASTLPLADAIQVIDIAVTIAFLISQF